MSKLSNQLKIEVSMSREGPGGKVRYASAEMNLLTDAYITLGRDAYGNATLALVGKCEDDLAAAELEAESEDQDG